MNKLTSEWRNLCEKYAVEFCRKHEYDCIYEIEQGEFWVGNNPGTIACIGDMFVSMDDIRYDIDNNVCKSYFEEWYWKALDRATDGLRYMNYQSFCAGCPDPISEEQMEKIKEAKENLESARKQFEAAIENHKVYKYDH